MNPEDLALFSDDGMIPAPLKPAIEDDPFADVSETAAIVPPDAPAPNPNTPPPEKAKRGKKTKVVIQCGDCGDPEPKPDHDATCALRRVNPLSSEKPLAPHVDPRTVSSTNPSTSLLVLEPGNALTIELGPKTLAALAELLGKK